MCRFWFNLAFCRDGIIVLARLNHTLFAGIHLLRIPCLGIFQDL